LVGVGVRGDVVGFHCCGEGHEGVVYGVDGYLGVLVEGRAGRRGLCVP
jgi:hypothetical protein